MATKKSIYNEKELTECLQDEKRRTAAFSFLVSNYSEQLYWHIRRIVLSHDDADDILQNTFIKAWSNIGNFRGDSQVLTWLYRIAINETLTFLGKRQLQSVSLESNEGSVAEQLESDTYFNGDHADALLQEAIGRLPEKQRIIFELKYYENMKYEEMSKILGTSVGALKASYHIAVKKIESFLKENN